MKFTLLDVDLGTVVLYARNSHLCRLDLLPASPGEVRERINQEFPGAEESPGAFKAAAGLLYRYFNGEPIEFDVPVDLADVRPFTRLVLEETRKIGYGRVSSYGAIAAALGIGKGARAVGQALKRNPIPIVVPCHRIVKGDGSLGGFGLGLEVKAELLAKEGISIPELQAFMTLS